MGDHRARHSGGTLAVAIAGLALQALLIVAVGALIVHNARIPR